MALYARATAEGLRDAQRHTFGDAVKAESAEIRDRDSLGDESTRYDARSVSKRSTPFSPLFLIGRRRRRDRVGRRPVILVAARHSAIIDGFESML
jgi:hypothetical protein